MKKARSNLGYTIVELLTVVGIISILTSLSISVFSDSLSSAKAVVCQANRRNMKAELSYAILLDSSDPTEIFAQVSARYSCPENGDYTLSYDPAEYAITLTCSEHGSALGVSGQGLSPVNTPFLANLNTAIKANKNNIMLGSSENFIHSTMPDTAVEKSRLLAVMQKAGVDMSAMDVKSWSVEFDRDKNNNTLRLFSFYWTTADVSTLKAGDTVIVIKYNFDEYTEKWRGWYSVYSCKVVEDADGYMKLNYNNKTEVQASKNTTADKTDKDIIYEIYKDAAIASSVKTHIDYGELD